MTEEKPSKWKSRKFWVAIIGGALFLLNHAFGFGLPDTAIIGLVGAYEVGEGLADISKK